MQVSDMSDIYKIYFTLIADFKGDFCKYYYNISDLHDDFVNFKSIMPQGVTKNLIKNDNQWGNETQGKVIFFSNTLVHLLKFHRLHAALHPQLSPVRNPQFNTLNHSRSVFFCSTTDHTRGPGTRYFCTISGMMIPPKPCKRFGLGLV
jgi:hypothetical protein